VCPSCGAGVSKAAPCCAYCGSEVVLPKPKGAVGPADRRTFCTRCGQLYPSAAARCPRCPPASDEERGTHCPRCGGTLEAKKIGGSRVDRCAACGGHWFDGDEIEHAVDVTTRGAAREEASSLKGGLPAWKQPTEDVRYLCCLRCRELMTRRQAVPRAGIVIDVCRKHGVWFDRGEFEHFVAFVRAGGLEVLRHDGIASAEAALRTAQIQAQLPRGGAWLGTPARDLDYVVGRAVWTGVRALGKVLLSR
jgi:Zn-finger nucleic acid-binding protein